ncbi:alpha-latroinsectotoxin-Lt1a-like [Daphnia pulex]|uniref:alpha-latroinsectotoxin-Lt1a-like n=1 Tax=Daphnia pulex TaxID=6669 RepID=UPI001EDF4048|nr:alpha-latroinsectotoxin-Lt1a-like [Daphnia pulex]
MIENLIYKGATIYSGDRLARTITEILISRDDVNSIRFVHIYKKNLLEHDLVNQEFPLTLAISHQARNCIDYILSQNPKVESFLINRKFSCPISVAIRRNDIETIRALVELDRFQHIVNTKVQKSLFYIHLAVEKNRHEIADILLYHGAHVNLQDNNGNTPAHFVNDIPTLRVLISHGARLELGNRNNETPIMAAEKDGRNAVYQYLRLYNHENRKKVYKTLDTRFYYNNSDRIEKAIAAMNIMSDETSQKGNYEDMPDLEEIPPIKHIPIPPRKEYDSASTIPEYDSATSKENTSESDYQQQRNSSVSNRKEIY